MQQVWKQDVSIANSATDSSSAYVGNVEVDAIEFPASMTGATVSLLGGAVRVDTDDEPSAYVAVHDDSGSLISITVVSEKIIALSGDQMRAFDAVHWVRLKSASAETGAKTITLIGRKRTR